MQPGAGNLASDVEAFHVRLPLQPSPDTTAHVVSCRDDGDGLPCDVQAVLQALGCDVGEMSKDLVSRSVADIQEDVVLSSLL
uniref:Similar to AO (L-ASPARTATE OXIDASE) n=1 Tax=Arundo donax TaxID=35708 RepID=A0A0A9EQM1_ARUDO